MKDGSDKDWKAAWQRLPKPTAGACLPPEAVAAFVAGTLEGSRNDDVLGHLSACPACREDVAAARDGDDSTAPAALRLRLYRLLPRRHSALPKLAIAAAVLVAFAVGVVVFWPDEQPAKPVVARPKPAPAPQDETPPRTEARPELPKPVPEPTRPAPKIEVPPAPDPVKPPVPVPTPEPVAPKPAPTPEKPVVPTPTPEKPAPEPTRVALKGSVLTVAGACVSQIDGDATAQALRAGQKRDFVGMLKLKADVAAAKVAIGSVTYFLQRGSELSVLLEEGRTKVQLARGEAFFDVTPGQGLFLVDTANGRVTVKGTRFLVSAEKAETEVLLQKGAVDFTALNQSVTLSPGERSSAAIGRAPSEPQKIDLTKRLAWLRSVEDSILIEADQMALQGAMSILPDATASAGRAIGVKAALKPGQDAVAEILAKRKQATPYTIWIRLHWAHAVPSALTLAVGDGLTWSSKDVTMNPTWQWVRVGVTELPDERFRVRLTDTQPGMRIDQVLITSDPELNPENK